MVRKTHKEIAEHYSWGNGCDGWRLADAHNLCVIQERMPPATSELRHYHQSASQFFYVLQGELCVESPGAKVTLQAGQGVYVEPMVSHLVKNDGSLAAEFLVISSSPTHNDRIEVD